MKKIKTLNKLLSSLTLLSPLSGMGFNNECKNQEIIIIKKADTLNNYFTTNAAPIQMGDIWVTVDDLDPTIITGYSSGEGVLRVASNIKQIKDYAFFPESSYSGTSQLQGLDLSQATSLITIGENSFRECTNLTGDLVISSSVTSIGREAFAWTNITSLDLSNATSLTDIVDYAFAACINLTGDLVIPSSVITIGQSAFKNTNFSSITIDPSNENFSFASNLGPNAKVFINAQDKVWKDNSTTAGALAWGDIIIPSNITTIQNNAFLETKITSLDLSNATNLTVIGENAFEDTYITSLNMSKITSLTTIGRFAFSSCPLTGNLIIPSSVRSIANYCFYDVQNIDNLYFLSENPPSFESDWQPTVLGKVYVPSEEAKEAYLAAPSFGFSADQIEIALPPQPTPEKSNIPLILGLLLGLGIPIILAVGFGIYYLTKKKKTTVKI